MAHKKIIAEDIERQFRKRVIVAVLIISTLWLCNVCIPIGGEFGDKFGVINSLFSGLAFAGIIITIYMQKHELELQRKELKSTRNVFKKQVQLMTDQQNDNTFFNLLSNHRQVVESFKKGKLKILGKIFKPVGTTTETISGYETIAEVVEKWEKYLQNYSDSFIQKKILDLGEGTTDAIDMLTSNSDILVLYDEICHIYKFVDDRFLEPEKKEFYRSTFWKNLSYSEKVLFEILYANIPGRNTGINFKGMYYEKANYINFHDYKLPEVQLKFNNGNGPHNIIVSHDSEFVESFFIIYEKNNEDFQLIEKIGFVSNGSVENLSINLETLLCQSDLGISSFPFEYSDKLNKYNYAFNYKLRKNNNEFDFLFGLNMHSNQNHNIKNYNKPEKELFDIYIDNTHTFSKKEASKILALIKD